MMLRRHFHSYLDEVRREGRYRIFADLERDAAAPALCEVARRE